MTFTLRDPEQILEPEEHPAVFDALARANEAIWRGRPWLITDHNGREIYTHRYPKGT